MKQFRLKNWLFHTLSYLVANIGFFLGIAIALRFTGIHLGSGDGNMVLLIAIIIIVYIQIPIGIILSIIFSHIKRRLVLKIAVYVLLNSVIVLFFAYYVYNVSEDYGFVYSTSGVLILSSFIYGFLLKKNHS